MGDRDIGRAITPPAGVAVADLVMMGREEAGKRLVDFLTGNDFSDEVQEGLNRLLTKAAASPGERVFVEVGSGEFADEVHSAMQAVTGDPVANGLAAVAYGLGAQGRFRHGETCGDCWVEATAFVGATA